MNESVERVKALVRGFFEVHTSLENAKKASSFLDDPDYIGHVPPFPDFKGSEGYQQFIAQIYAAYPDAHFDIEDIFANEAKNFQPKAVVRFMFRGTHEGTSEFSGTPTGKQVTVPGISILSLETRFRDGRPRIVESWTNFDFLGLMQQVGVSPPTAYRERA